jgi:predicted anti-sigma-YlaC factor YlaD
MECTTIREACSASLDGEDAGLPAEAMAAHLRMCRECREFVAHAERLHAAMSAQAPVAPDVTVSVLEGTRREQRSGGRGTAALRLGLVAVAVAQLGLAVPGLFLGSDDGAPIHIAHEIGAWDLALAVGFLFAAWRPLRAVGLLPFVAALSAGLLLTAVIDIASGRAVAVTETTHLLELIGTALLWLLVTARSPRPTRRVLRVV